LNCNYNSTSLYRIHGLLVESEIPLQARGVGPDDGGSSADRSFANDAEQAAHYRVVFGGIRDCPHSPPPGRILAENHREGFGYWAVEAPGDPRCWTLRYAGICEATLDRERRTITIHRSPEADPGMIPIFIEGSVLAHALTAEGFLVLHASAVEVGGRALAILGPSGAGKSTLAALFCAAGARLVADDVLRVDGSPSGPVCFPGNLGLRLRPAAARVGRDISGASVGRTADGRTAVVLAHPVDAPLELGAVLVPTPTRTATRLEVHRLGAMKGLQELLRYPRLTRWQVPERIARLFEVTGEVAEGVPVYRATVPWGPPFPPQLAYELLSGVGLGEREASA